MPNKKLRRASLQHMQKIAKSEKDQPAPASKAAAEKIRKAFTGQKEEAKFLRKQQMKKLFRKRIKK